MLGVSRQVLGKGRAERTGNGNPVYRFNDRFIQVTPDRLPSDRCTASCSVASNPRRHSLVFPLCSGGFCVAPVASGFHFISCAIVMEMPT